MRQQSSRMCRVMSLESDVYQSAAYAILNTEMSKRIEAELTCPQCQARFVDDVFLTLWIEDPKNRAMVFEDCVNVVHCPKCGWEIRVINTLFCTNRDLNFAVWYEPEPDPDIDVQAEGYAAIMGPTSYFATAPRVADWEEFKETILKFERGELKGEAPTKVDFSALENIARQEAEQRRRERVTFVDRLRGLFSRNKGG